MRVDLAEIEFAGEQEDDGADGGEAAIATRLALSCLEQAVDGFEEAVGLARLSPGNDAVEMRADQLRDFFHGFDLRAHDVGRPLREHAAHDIDLLALPDGHFKVLHLWTPKVLQAERWEL